MKSDVFLSEHTKNLLNSALFSDSHALEIICPTVSGYKSIKEYIILKSGIKESTAINIYPVNRSIGIDNIRELRLKFSLKSFSGIKQFIFINDAEAMTREAQNALLKILEEPPRNTVFVIFNQDENALLPTIHSRCTIINVGKPRLNDLEQYFIKNGYKGVDVASALAISDGWPELAESILINESTEFTEILKYAKELLQKPLNEKLMDVDKLSKDKTRIKIVLFAIERLAKSTFDKKVQSSGAVDQRWLNILETVENSQMLYKHNVTSRLLLTNLMVNL